MCSRYYRLDPTRRLRFEREVARSCGVPIIGINQWDCGKYPAGGHDVIEDLFDVEKVSFSNSEGEAMGRSLDELFEKIMKNIAKKLN